jgi:hypothetical protein
VRPLTRAQSSFGGHGLHYTNQRTYPRWCVA